MDTPAGRPLSGADFIRQFFPSSPYVAHLGMQLTDIQPGTAWQVAASLMINLSKLLLQKSIPQKITLPIVYHFGALESKLR